MKLPKELTKVTPFSKYLALFLFLILPFAGFYLGTQYQQVLNSAKQLELSSKVVMTRPTPTPVDDTANWKMYVNKKYNFSLNYPSNLQIEEKQFPGFYERILFTTAFNDPNYINIGVFIHNNSSNTDLKKWIDNYVIQNLPNGKIGSIVRGNIASYNFSDVTGYTFIGGKESENKYVFFKKENAIFEFRLTGSGTGGSYSKRAEQVFDQILSTFKFTQ